jgi:glycosyltransferase involved in cell wall biosynthesis
MKAVLDITVLLPVYNEQENLEQLADELQDVLGNLGKTFEMLFINDGSTDGSLEVLKKLDLKVPQARFISFEDNYGQSAAFGAGFKEARGNIVVTLDSDGQNDPKDIPRLLNCLEASDVDAVCGYRKERKDSWIKKATSRFANWFRNVVSRDSIKDTGCSLKVFRKKILNEFFYFNGMHRFFPTLIKIAGGKVIQAPVQHRPRLKGVSKYSTTNRILHPFIDLLAVRWMKEKSLCYKIKDHHE